MNSLFRTTNQWLAPLTGLALVTACAADTQPPPSTDGNVFSLMADQVQDPDDLDLDRTVTGVFNRHRRVYGFVFEARAGATVHPVVETQAGSDAYQTMAGAPLDTIAAVFGPMKGDDRGPRIAQEDDSAEGVEADLPAIEIQEDGRYLLVFSSWDDPGTNGRYTVEVGCSGTDFQCTRPVPNDQCIEGTHFVEGGTIIGTEQWQKCEVVLLEQVHVEEGAVLTISPGVTIKGNYVGEGSYGTVSLVVDGTLQAVGTEELPIHFTSLLENGWKGIVLNGASSTIEHAFVEKAATGIEMNGSNNTIRHVDVNSGQLAIDFGAGSVDNVLSNIRITQIDNGIRIGDGASATVDNAVIQGRGDTGRGVEGNSAGLSHIRRSFIGGFGYGIHLRDSALEVFDSTITQNANGVFVTGEDSGLNVEASDHIACPAMTYNPPVYSPPPRTYYYYDPVFVRTDIVHNTGYAIRLEAPELLVVEDSNVRKNGSGITIRADELHEDSRIIRNNIFDNTGTVQVESYHQRGVLRLSDNYWDDISDPDLSANWRMEHSQDVHCWRQRYNGSSCYSPYTYASRDGENLCRSNSTYNVTWSSDFEFTGFSPAPLEAGPNEAVLSQRVLEARAAMPSLD